MHRRYLNVLSRYYYTLTEICQQSLCVFYIHFSLKKLLVWGHDYKLTLYVITERTNCSCTCDSELLYDILAFQTYLQDLEISSFLGVHFALVLPMQFCIAPCVVPLHENGGTDRGTGSEAHKALV